MFCYDLNTIEKLSLIYYEYYIFAHCLRLPSTDRRAVFTITRSEMSTIQIAVRDYARVPTPRPEGGAPTPHLRRYSTFCYSTNINKVYQIECMLCLLRGFYIRKKHGLIVY